MLMEMVLILLQQALAYINTAPDTDQSMRKQPKIYKSRMPVILQVKLDEPFLDFNVHFMYTIYTHNLTNFNNPHIYNVIGMTV